ncbi:MAG: 3-hydroxyacyl-CoA dehydrogenase family protein [Deltaproteobacteria bacterium]|nr:3-hydroxyacyl-CoA dehydrogenase family protein [Deltaproteobacteria bacterium]
MSHHEQTKGWIAVLGAGTMGAGIAQVAAAQGYEVSLYDPSQPQLDRALSGMRASLEKLVSKAKITAEIRDRALGSVRVVRTVGAAVEQATVVIEAVPERMEIKRSLFEEVDRLAPAGALLGSNTSSLSITEIASCVRDPARVVGLHFFNPVPVMELLEVVRGVRTSEETVDAAMELAKGLAKTAIVVRDFPGFATSRLGVAIGAEAMRMLEQGVASAEDIDRAMELGYRHPMGPLKLTDLVGLDVRLAILEHLHREIGEQFRPPAILRQLVRAGKLGKKTGEGFYRWDL